MQSITTLNLNLQYPNYTTTMYAVQHDRLSRKITAMLFDGSVPFEPEYGTLAVVRYKKPDGTCGFYDTDEDGNTAVTWDGYTATIMLAEQALTVAGTVLCQVQFYNGDEQRLSSFTWKIIVEANACPDDEITSSDYFNILTQQIASIMDVVTNMPAPATVLPQMDGTAAIGVLGEFARSDHVHPATPLEHIEEVGVVNLNTLTQAGWYHGESDNTVTLTGVDSFYCLVLNDGSYVKQFIVGEFSAGTALWMRYYNGSTWNNKRVDFTDNGTQAYVVQFELGANSTIKISHTSPILLYTDRGGMWTEGSAQRSLTQIASASNITVTRVSASVIQITSTQGYGTTVTAISSTLPTLTS